MAGRRAAIQPGPAAGSVKHLAIACAGRTGGLAYRRANIDSGPLNNLARSRLPVASLRNTRWPGLLLINDGRKAAPRVLGQYATPTTMDRTAPWAP